MSTAEAQIVADRVGAFRPMEAQESFAQQFNLAQPEKAMSLYQKIMHEHTQQQFEMATASDRRRRSMRNDSVSLSS